MFQSLKTKNNKTSIFKNMANPMNYSKSPGVDSSSVKGNEKDRLVHCRHCGFICDTERDVNLPDGSYAGFGIQQGVALTAGTSIGDKRVPAAGDIGQTAETYYEREVLGGCPCCGSYVYHPGQKLTQVPPIGG